MNYDFIIWMLAIYLLILTTLVGIGFKEVYKNLKQLKQYVLFLLEENNSEGARLFKGLDIKWNPTDDQKGDCIIPDDVIIKHNADKFNKEFFKKSGDQK